MSAEVEQAQPPKPARRKRLQLRTASFDDYDQLMRLESLLSPQTLPFDDWRRIWTDSPLWPAIGGWWPIGWVLEGASGELVGCMGNVPLLYHFRGERLMAATGRAWVVDPNHRAFGSALRLVREHFDQPSVDLVVDTSVSPDASERFHHVANRIPAGDWETIAYFVTDYHAFASRALHKLNVPLAKALAPAAGLGLHLKDAVAGRRFPKSRRGVEIEVTDRFDIRFDVFWSELLKQKPETVLAARDSATLSWHFEVPLRKRRVWIFTASRNGRLRGYAIFERKDSGEEELRRMRLTDFQTIEPEADLLEDLLGAALRRCAAEDIAVLDKSGLGLGMRAFDDAAPYRRKQPWPFWYRSQNPALARELRNPDYWEPTEYDGDASIG